MILSTAAHTPSAPEPPGTAEALPPADQALAAVLFEQLAYLIRFAGVERSRLERVSAILLETFA